MAATFHPLLGFERSSQLFLTDGVRASIGAIVTEAQHIKGSIVLGHRRQARHVSWPLLTVEGLEQSAVQYRHALLRSHLRFNVSDRYLLGVERAANACATLHGATSPLRSAIELGDTGDGDWRYQR